MADLFTVTVTISIIVSAHTVQQLRSSYATTAKACFEYFETLGRGHGMVVLEEK